MKLSFQDDYAYHLFMYGDGFKKILEWFIDRYPNQYALTVLFPIMQERALRDEELTKIVDIFFNKWKHDERCMSEDTKIFVRLFEVEL